ncbi:LacI family DNA-binding transcriptional regulator [Stakelama marina]|uniref:LacI family DNA-binding transcriptional regulator n=1 Tax=Stakelama marina TaxID=2826939 RepID=A0A8T4I7R9_9SPHN|nr:LacI family DNA-binding transcriptional regulator [Stakelama marina]MBR0551038.1 LacI family DNA-binding transcriptional regulator [Stakelama marina]
MAQATIRDVAKKAEVSVASVSRALNGHTNVRSELKERVETAARELGYFPHAGARSLSMARAHAIGVMLPDLHGEFFSEVVRGMDREASGRGLQLLLSNMHANPDQAAEALRTMRGRVDGLIVMAPDIDTDTLLQHMPATLPAVFINCHGDAQGRAELRVDNFAAAAEMVAHLVETGRRNIVHLSGSAGNREADERERGYREAMRKAGLEPRVICGNFTETGGAEAAAAIIEDQKPTDAVFAANDMMAIGAMVAFRDAGIGVPQQIAVAGFDDVPLARLISPGLTTMRVNIADIGARALARLADMIDGRDDSEVECLRPELIVRQTTS